MGTVSRWCFYLLPPGKKLGHFATEKSYLNFFLRILQRKIKKWFAKLNEPGTFFLSKHGPKKLLLPGDHALAASPGIFVLCWGCVAMIMGGWIFWGKIFVEMDFDQNTFVLKTLFGGRACCDEDKLLGWFFGCTSGNGFRWNWWWGRSTSPVRDVFQIFRVKMNIQAVFSWQEFQGQKDIQWFFSPFLLVWVFITLHSIRHKGCTPVI